MESDTGSETILGDDLRKIPPVPFNEKNQGRIKTQSLQCAMESDTGSETTLGDDLRKIPPIPLFNGKNQRRIRIQSLQCAMESDAGSETALRDDLRKIPPVLQLNEKIKGVRIQSSLCAIESDTGTGETRTTLSTWAQGGMTPLQLAAALSSCDTTSVTFGRNFISPSQQR